MSRNTTPFEGQPRDSLEFERDQKQLAYRQAVKKWRERGFNRHSARIVAREESRKPTDRKG